MQTINFSYNWNNKLECKAFTTIRLHNSKKYKVGELYSIRLQTSKGVELKGHAEIVDIKTISFDQINEFIAHLDTGYNAKETKRILLKMYKTKNKKFDFILLKKVK